MGKSPDCSKCDDDGKLIDDTYCECLSRRTKWIYEQIENNKNISSLIEENASYEEILQRILLVQEYDDLNCPCPSYELIGPGTDWLLAQVKLLRNNCNELIVVLQKQANAMCCLDTTAKLLNQYSKDVGNETNK